MRGVMSGKLTNWMVLWCVVSALWLSGCEREASQSDAAAGDAATEVADGESSGSDASSGLDASHDSEASRDSEASPASAPATVAAPADAGRAFLAENGNRAGVVTTASGLQYEVLASGDGGTPGPTDRVTTHYHGTLIDGQVFDSSMQRGEPIEFPVNGVISGWTEALQLMRVGDRWKLYIPPELAYGKRGAGGVIGPDETLIFEVELLGVRSG